MNVYDTPYGKHLAGRIEEVTQKLREYLASGSDVIVPTEHENILTIDHLDDTIVQWNFPIIIDEKAYIDTRPFKNKSGVVNNRAEYNASIQRAVLEMEWCENLSNWEAITPQIAAIYGTWLANTIAIRYNRSSSDSLLMRVGFTLLYICNSLPFDEAVSRKLASGDLNATLMKQASRYTDVPSNFISDMFFSEENTEEGEMTFMEAISVVGPNAYQMRMDRALAWLMEKMESRVDGFNASTLLNLVVHSGWVGNLSGELISTSLYHPPIFTSLILRSLEFSYYKRTGIGMAIRESGRKAKIDTVATWYKHIN